MKIRKRNNTIINESGYSLVGVLLLIVLISVLGLGLMAMTTTSVKTTTSERSDQSAFYIAEAGVTYEMERIKKIIEDVNAQSKNENEFYTKFNEKVLKETTLSNGVFENVYGDTPKAIVNVELVPGENEHTYQITSIGTIGEQERDVARKFTLKYTSGGGSGIQIIPGMAAFVNDTIRLTEGAFIKGNGKEVGNIGTRRAGGGSIFVSGGPTITGSIYVPPRSEGIALTGDVETIKKFPTPVGKEMGDLPELPDFPAIPQDYLVPPNKEITDSGGYNKTYVIKNGNLLIEHYLTENYTLSVQNNMQFNEIRIEQNKNLFLDLGSTDREIVVKDLKVNNGHIILKGKGSLTIYVTGLLTMGSGSTINNNGDVKKLNVFFKGAHDPNKPKTLKLGGAQKIFGSLYAEDANIEFGSGGGFQGNLLTGGKSVKFSGGSRTKSSLVLAPNAHVELLEGGQITGAVIAQSLNMKGGAGITYKQIDVPIFGETDSSNGSNGNGYDLTSYPLIEQRK